MESGKTSETTQLSYFRRARYTAEFCGGILAGLGIGALVMAPLLAIICGNGKWFYLLLVFSVFYLIGNIIAIHAQRKNANGGNAQNKQAP